MIIPCRDDVSLLNTAAEPGNRDDASLSHALHCAGIDESSWSAVLARVAARLGADAASLSSLLASDSARSFHGSWCLQPALGERCSTYLETARPRLEAAGLRGDLVSGAVLDIGELAYDRELASAPILTGEPGHGLGIVLTDERDEVDGPRAWLTVWRSPLQPPFSTADRSTATALAPLLRASLLAHWRRRRQGLCAGWNEQQLEQLCPAFFLLGENGAVLYTSSAAAELLCGSRALELRDGKLWCAGAPLNEGLEPADREAVREESTRRDGFTLRLVPLQTRSFGRSLFRWFPQPAFLVLAMGWAAGLGRTVDAVPDCTTRTPVLTKTEIETAIQLIQGRSVPEIAEGTGISRNTVRVHLRSLFVKLGKHRPPYP